MQSQTVVKKKLLQHFKEPGAGKAPLLPPLAIIKTHNQVGGGGQAKSLLVAGLVAPRDKIVTRFINTGNKKKS